MKPVAIYLDYLATTPVDPRVVAKMQASLLQHYGNPASPHCFGFEARAEVDAARYAVAQLVGADPAEIIWTSGATESINLALKGAALFYQRQGRHIITMTTEHKAVLETCRYLASMGFDITYLNPEKNGLLDLKKLQDAIRADTILCSIMQVNNETGVIQDIEKISTLLKSRGVLFHVDAAQSIGKLPIDMKKMGIDLLSLASHKIYGPKGVGALCVRRNPRVQLISQLHGGDTDNFLRAGTLPTHQIVGMGEAYKIAAENMTSDVPRIAALRDRLWCNLSVNSRLSQNGDALHRVCGCLNVRIEGVAAEDLLKKLPEIAFSTGSACNAADPEPSHVLMAMGLSKVAANQSIRLSVGRFTTEKDIDEAATRILSVL